MSLGQFVTTGEPMRLEGEGLVLREWTECDLDVMVQLFDEPIVAWRTPLPSPFKRVDAEQRLARARRRDPLLLAVTVEDEQPLGEVTITSQAHLAYIIGRQHRGQSLASRALLTAADYAFLMLRTPVLRLEIEPDNHARAAVARRAGFAPSNAPGATVEDKGRTFTLQLWEGRRDPPGAG